MRLKVGKKERKKEGEASEREPASQPNDDGIGLHATFTETQPQSHPLSHATTFYLLAFHFDRD
jgi:hypothetical protein